MRAVLQLRRVWRLPLRDRPMTRARTKRSRRCSACSRRAHARRCDDPGAGRAAERAAGRRRAARPAQRAHAGGQRHEHRRAGWRRWRAAGGCGDCCRRTTGDCGDSDALQQADPHDHQHARSRRSHRRQRVARQAARHRRAAARSGDGSSVGAGAHDRSGACRRVDRRLSPERRHHAADQQHLRHTDQGLLPERRAGGDLSRAQRRTPTATASCTSAPRT